MAVEHGLIIQDHKTGNTYVDPSLVGDFRDFKILTYTSNEDRKQVLQLEYLHRPSDKTVDNLQLKRIYLVFRPGALPRFLIDAQEILKSTDTLYDELKSWGTP